MKSAVRFFCLWISVGLLAAGLIEQVGAEQYLAVADAQKLCFPGADRFEAEELVLTAQQAKAVQKAAGIKVPRAAARLRLAWEGERLAGILMVDQVIGKHELIDFAVAVTPAGEVVQVEILEYREHYGQAVRSAKWREQFRGKTSRSDLKLNRDIYNVSGATMSCRHVSEGVKRLLATYDLVVRPQLVASGRLSSSRQLSQW